MPKNKITQDPDFPEFIRAYRENIRFKYGDDNLKNYPEFGSIDPEKIRLMTGYFLELIYPEWEERVRLDSAFDSLKGFVNTPSKVFGLLGSLGVSLWKIGRFLPESFRAGMAALSSYLTAHSMEERMLEEAKNFIALGESIREERNFKKLLKVIPRQEADEFRKDTVSLFKTLSNNELVDRIIMIMEGIMDKMKNKTSLYSPQDVEGIGLGLSILKRGRDILQTLSESEKALIHSAIDRIEKDYYESAIE